MTEQAFDDQCTGANPRHPYSEIKQLYSTVTTVASPAPLNERQEWEENEYSADKICKNNNNLPRRRHGTQSLKRPLKADVLNEALTKLAEEIT